MGHRLNRLDESVFISVSNLLLTEFGIHHRLDCVLYDFHVDLIKFARPRYESGKTMIETINFKQISCYPAFKSRDTMIDLNTNGGIDQQ